MENLDKTLQVVREFCKNGISTIDVANKLGVHRSTATSYLSTLELKEDVFSQHGLWFPGKNPVQRPKEFEIFDILIKNGVLTEESIQQIELVELIEYLQNHAGQSKEEIVKGILDWYANSRVRAIKKIKEEFEKGESKS